MRKKMGLLGFVLILLCAGMPVCASELQTEEKWKTVTTDDGVIEMSLPEEWLMFTQETIPDEQFCDENGLEREILIENINSTGEGIFSLRIRDNGMIILYRSSAQGFMDFHLTSDKQKESIIEVMQESLADVTGEIRVKYHSLYDGGNGQYYILNIYDNSTQEIVRRLYGTIRGEEFIMIVFDGSKELISDIEFQEQVIDKVISIRPEVTQEMIDLERDVAAARTVGRQVGSLMISVILGFVLSGIIVACVNAGKQNSGE